MSKPEGGGNNSRRGPFWERWRRRFRRICKEAGLFVLRGAATAVGGAAVTYGVIWVQSRVGG